MKRIKADAILCSDIHLRNDIPVCRTDNFIQAMWTKIDIISELQKENECPILHAGDLFNHWKPEPWLLSQASKHIPNQFFSIYGQHDLPLHNLDLAQKSGLYNLQVNKKLSILKYGHFGQSLQKSFEIKGRSIAVWHHMVWTKQRPWPGCKDPSALRILQSSNFDLILTGDNHESFTVKYEEKLLVNPGSLMRTRADQINHKPCVFLYYAQNNTVKPYYFIVNPNDISRKHITAINSRDKRIEAFLGRLNKDWIVELSFEQNIKNFVEKNKININVQNIIWKSLEEDYE